MIYKICTKEILSKKLRRPSISILENRKVKYFALFFGLIPNQNKSNMIDSMGFNTKAKLK